MHPNMPLRESQARWPHEPLAPLDQAIVTQAFEPVLQVLETFSPFVELAGPGHAYMDASGLERLHGTPRDLARAVRTAVHESTDYEARIGVATSKFAANVATRTAGDSGMRVVPAGETLGDLGPLEVTALGLEPATVQRLRALGVVHVAQFAALPAHSLLHRYGKSALRAHQGLHGRLTEPLYARSHPLRIHDRLDFEWVVHNPDRLLFACKMLTDRLAEQLVRNHVACQTLVVRWSFDNGSQNEREINLAEPTARSEALLCYLRWHIEGLQIGSGIIGIRLRADNLVETGSWQLKLLTGTEGRPENTERRRRALQALGRLQARWGNDTVRQAELHENPRPERTFGWIAPTLPAPGTEPTVGTRVMHPFWLLDPPQPMRVTDLPPQRRVLRIEGEDHIVTMQAGPWRMHDRPWDDDRAERDYYQFQCRGGAAFLCFYDRAGETWYLQGRYD